MQAVRTDLAMEQTEFYKNNLPEGLSLSQEEKAGLKITRVEVVSEEGVKLTGKNKGKYITIDIPLATAGAEPADDVTHLLAQEISALLPKEGMVLVVGLGNIHITPDALGPQTVHQILATRHIPDQVAKESGLENLRPVAALAPGVLGQTGIETGEIIHSIVTDIHPGAVVVIDALAARSLERMGRTIQLSDNGISPGSGVLNSRKELSRETLGVPVISVGIPTVVDGATLVQDLVEKENLPMKKQAQTVMVTPRDIDVIIERGAKNLSLAINKALQPQLSLEDITYLVS
ncbi:GPR endopeptidase [Youxingia wuxianensis]|uniref:Germination protease n=1 Tax=Youxingia wuxianensis TaxID=2763678 RepID=A0A926EP77_9FIRM|nr:GPR endopeptidase [Youxingia wuxianensis]MBC8585980.1 GPR endopeptidase [Youxingia wuxianensis]